VKGVRDRGDVDRDHHDGDRDRAEQKMHSADTRIEAEQVTQHGSALSGAVDQRLLSEL
jgi:hypothetical protein